MKKIIFAMKNRIKNNKKRSLLLFFITGVVTLLLSLLINFAGTLAFILSLILTPTFKIQEIKVLGNGIIQAKNVKLIHEGKNLVDAPEVEITYNLKNSFSHWLQKIKVIDPSILIERKDSNVNIVEAFATGGSGKSGTGVPIGIIEAINGKVLYRDLSYEFPIEKELYEVNGFVSFDKIKGIDLLFAGENGKEKVSYSFSNYEFDYWMNIKTENVLMTTNLLQYAYYYEQVQYLGGEVNLDLTISPEGLNGYADIKSATVEYLDFSEKAKNIDGHVEFLGNKIKLDADFYIFDQKKKFTLDFDFKKGLDIKIILGEMDFNQVGHYILLQDLGTQFDGVIFKDFLVSLTLDEQDIFAVDITYGVEDMSLDSVSLKNNRGSIRYSENILTFNFLTSDFSVKNFQRRLKLDGILDNGKLDIKYQVGDFLGEGIIYLNERSLEFENRKGFIGLKGTFDYDSKIMQLDELDSSKENFELIYDFSKDEVVKFDGNFSFNILDLGVIKVYGTGENNEFNFEKIDFYQKDNLVLTGDGILDLNTFYYKFSFNSESFTLKRDIAEKEFEIYLSSNGEIEGFGSQFKLDLDGTIEKVIYDSFRLNGLKYNLRFSDNTLEILNLRNDYLSFDGKYDIEKSSLSGKYRVENLSHDELPFENLRYEIVQAEGTLRGTIEDIQADLNIKDSKIYVFEEEYVKVKGDGELKNKVFSIKNLLLNGTSKFVGKYDFTTSKYELSGDINEGNLSKYFKDRNFKYKVLGKINLQGESKKITLDSSFNIEDIYFKGDLLGELKGDVRYSADNLSDGILQVNSLNIFRERYEIAKISGKVNFKSKEVKLNAQEREIQLQKLFSNEKMQGVFSLEGELDGTFDAPRYRMKLTSNKVFIQGVEFTGVSTAVSGDQNIVRLDNLAFNYIDNKLDAKGFYKFNDSDYLLTIHSNEIKLDFLNLIFENSDIKSISGEAQMDLVLSSGGNIGKFRGNNIFFKTDNSGIIGENISFNFNLDKRKLVIEKFTGNLNSGDANITGYLEIPSLVEMKKNPYFYEELDYNLDISLLNFYYDSKDYYNFTIDSALNISGNKISGNIDILNGNLEQIPGIGDGFSIFGMIKKFIFAAIPKISKDDKSIDREYGSETAFKDSVEVDLNFKIIDGIKVDIQSIWNIVEDINGVIKGGGKLAGKGNKVNFMGQFEVENGSFILGENDYKVLTGRLVFNNPYEYFPNINPILTLETYSPLDNIEIALNGELKSLNFRIKTKDEHSSGTLASLFKNEMNYSEENGRLGASITVLKGILGAQITNSFLGPISRTIKKMFGLSKLRITADITDNFNQYIENEEAQNDETNFNFGIKIVAEDSIYKEKLFAVADARITSSKDNEDKKTMYSGYNNFDRYRTGFEYRYQPGKSIGIGVENKGVDGYSKENQQISRQKLNYYIDFKIEKKYDSLVDIYRGFIQSIFN